MMNFPSAATTLAPWGIVAPRRPIAVIRSRRMTIWTSRTGAPPFPSISVPPSITRTSCGGAWPDSSPAHTQARSAPASNDQRINFTILIPQTSGCATLIKVVLLIEMHR